MSSSTSRLYVGEWLRGEEAPDLIIYTCSDALRSRQVHSAVLALNAISAQDRLCYVRAFLEHLRQRATVKEVINARHPDDPVVAHYRNVGQARVGQDVFVQMEPLATYDAGEVPLQSVTHYMSNW